MKWLFYNIKTFSNWPIVLLATRLRSGCSLRLRNGIVFYTPNAAYSVAIIREVFTKEVYKLDIPTPEIIVDVGGYIGTSALYFAHKYPTATIHVFEPEKSNFEALVFNTREYDNIHCYNIAVASKTGEMQLHVKGEGYGTNSLYAKDGIPTTVKTITLRDFLHESKISKVDLLKLDCEGAEKEILENLPSEVRAVVTEWGKNNPALPTFAIPVFLTAKV